MNIAVSIECEIAWKAYLGHRYQLLDATVQSTATTLEQCALLCRQSTSCIAYQVDLAWCYEITVGCINNRISNEETH